MASVIKINRRNLTLKKSYTEPNFSGKSVLVSDPWEYVELWLKRNNKNNDALFYWQQAKQFYEATLSLPLTAAPLTSYYCFLNATKTLLLIRGIQFADRHGISGYRKNSKPALSNEMIILKQHGIMPALCKCFDDQISSGNSKVEYTLKDLLRNLVYIHRTYCLTYKSEGSKELFIPLEDVFLVKKDKSSECWFSAEIDEKYATKHTMNKIGDFFERDVNFEERFIVRLKKRSKWTGNKTVSTTKFINYHKKARKHVQYIAGASSRWYIKRTNIKESISLNSLAITFAAMHRLSELSRYEPITLSKHLNSQQNWLLSEFIQSAPYQFIHEIASEITGEEFLVPRRGI
ncbi:YaaC family protein [Exiguobacterium sp. s56]|uniref:YaaC family protein n=1 Tax=Exiguobacterium sp. s56 TaxID=2751232 RepID=UPI001BE92C92|nr:YaaC family protein [Exiguobacterium sp. s56]